MGAKPTKEQLIAMIGADKAAFIDKYYAPLLRTLDRYQIDTKLRIAHFLAQIAFESGGFRWTEEIWPNPALNADGVATNGNKWQLTYEGRSGLGNTKKGDGYRFRGRGLIQLTGRANYAKYGKAIKIDVQTRPSLLSQPPLAVDAAGWFWNTRGLNALADKNDIVGITKRVNGGLLGLDQRKALFSKAMSALSSTRQFSSKFTWTIPLIIGIIVVKKLRS